VISPPATGGGPPLPGTRLWLPASLALMMSVLLDPASSLVPELSPVDAKPGAPDFAHAGIPAASARVRGRARGRVSHRMTNPSRATGRGAFGQAIMYHALPEMRCKLGILTKFTIAWSSQADHSLNPRWNRQLRLFYSPRAREQRARSRDHYRSNWPLCKGNRMYRDTINEPFRLRWFDIAAGHGPHEPGNQLRGRSWIQA